MERLTGTEREQFLELLDPDGDGAVDVHHLEKLFHYSEGTSSPQNAAIGTDPTHAPCTLLEPVYLGTAVTDGWCLSEAQVKKWPGRAADACEQNLQRTCARRGRGRCRVDQVAVACRPGVYEWVGVGRGEREDVRRRRCAADACRVHRLGRRGLGLGGGERRAVEWSVGRPQGRGGQSVDRDALRVGRLGVARLPARDEWGERPPGARPQPRVRGRCGRMEAGVHVGRERRRRVDSHALRRRRCVAPVAVTDAGVVRVRLVVQPAARVQRRAVQRHGEVRRGGTAPPLRRAPVRVRSGRLPVPAAALAAAYLQRGAGGGGHHVPGRRGRHPRRRRQLCLRVVRLRSLVQPARRVRRRAMQWHAQWVRRRALRRGDTAPPL